MRKVLFLALLLGGCQTMPPAPPPEPPPPREPVACVDAASIPPEPPTVGDKFNGDAKHDLQILAPNAKALRQWGQAMQAMLVACAAGERAAEQSHEVVQPLPGK